MVKRLKIANTSFKLTINNTRFAKLKIKKSPETLRNADGKCLRIKKMYS